MTIRPITLKRTGEIRYEVRVNLPRGFEGKTKKQLYRRCVTKSQARREQVRLEREAARMAEKWKSEQKQSVEKLEFAKISEEQLHHLACRHDWGVARPAETEST